MPPKEKPEDALQTGGGRCALLAPQNLSLSFRFQGSVRPVTQAMVKSRCPGNLPTPRAKATRRGRPGAGVHDTADLRARHESQQAMMAEAKARLDLAKTEQNNRQLLAKNFISQNAFDSTVSSLEVAESITKLPWHRRHYAKALADAQVRAPALAASWPSVW